MRSINTISAIIMAVRIWCWVLGVGLCYLCCSAAFGVRRQHSQMVEVGFIRLTGRCDGPAPQFSPSPATASRRHTRAAGARARAGAVFMLLLVALILPLEFS